LDRHHRAGVNFVDCVRSGLRQSTAPVVGGAHTNRFAGCANSATESSHRRSNAIDANDSTNPNTDDDTGAFADGNDRASDTDTCAHNNGDSKANRNTHCDSTPNGHMDPAPKPDADSNPRTC
jgi:hypothetical protein